MQLSKARFLIFASIVLLVFSGPSKAEEYFGSFRVNLTGSHAYQWEKYQNNFSATRFAIRLSDTNPESFTHSIWYTCHSNSCSDRGRSGFLYDLKMRNGGNWRILAEGKRVLWKGPVCYKGQNLSKFGDCNSYNSSNNNSSSSSSNSSNSDGSHLKEMADKTLCFGATNADGNWEQEYAYKKFINEAKSRRLSLERCSELTGRVVAASKPDDKEIICRHALSEDRLNWEPEKIFSTYVLEAKRRGYTTEDCAKINSYKATPTATANTSKKELIDGIEARLKKLKKLEDGGLITSEEAAEKRKEILRDM